MTVSHYPLNRSTKKFDTRDYVGEMTWYAKFRLKKVGGTRTSRQYGDKC